MPTSIAESTIFLTVTSDLSDDARVTGESVDLFNAAIGQFFDIRFSLRTSDDAPPAIGQPHAQGVINAIVRKCDYMIRLVGHRWGSPTGAPGSESGSHEEWLIAEESRVDPDRPMNDTALLFKDTPSEPGGDPRQLGLVKEFRTAKEADHTHKFSTYSTDTELRRIIVTLLGSWAAKQLGLPDFPGASASEPPAVARLSLADQSARIRRAAALSESGEIVLAEAEYHKLLSESRTPEVLLAFGSFLLLQGRHTAAKSILYEAAVQVVGYPPSTLTAAIRHNFAVVKLALREDAADLAKDAIREARAAGAKDVEALAEFVYASILGTSSAAGRREHAIAAMELFEELGDHVRASHAALAAAWASRTLRQVESARTLAGKAVTLAREGGDAAALAVALEFTGRLRLDARDPFAAIRILNEALASSSETSAPQRQHILELLANAMRDVGYYDGARECASGALSLAMSVGDLSGIADNEGLLASIELRAGNLTAAEHHSSRSVAFEERLDRGLLYKAYWEKANIAKARKDWPAADTAVVAALGYLPDPPEPFDVASLKLLRAQILLESGREEEARSVWNDVRPAVVDLGWKEILQSGDCEFRTE